MFYESVLPVAARNMNGRSRRSYQETVQILQSFMSVRPDSNILRINMHLKPFIPDLGRACCEYAHSRRASLISGSTDGRIPHRGRKAPHSSIDRRPKGGVHSRRPVVRDGNPSTAVSGVFSIILLSLLKAHHLHLPCRLCVLVRL